MGFSDNPAGATATVEAPTEQPEATAIVKVLRHFGRPVPIEFVARSVGSTRAATLAALQPLLVEGHVRLDDKEHVRLDEDRVAPTT